MAAVVVSLPAAAQFVPNETQVCPGAARVTDPEFDLGTQQIAYYDGNGAIRVAPVLADGSIDTPACAGLVVARSATISLPGLPFKNGPEWGLSARGLELYYTKLDRDGRAFMARARFDGAWRQSALPESTDRGLALVSFSAADVEPSLVYMHTPSTGVYALAWREAGRPETETLLTGAVVDPGTAGAPRWVPGRHALSLAMPDAGGTLQAVLYDIKTAQFSYLTSDAGSKDEVWLWPAPEFGGALALMTVVDGCCLRFYREEAGQWQLYREFDARTFSTRPRILSPEILVHEGRSYVAMQLATRRAGPSETWMAEVGLGGLQPLLLSDPALPGLLRSEPEWMVTPAGVFVYVSASDESNRYALNRMKTPLAVGPSR